MAMVRRAMTLDWEYLVAAATTRCPYHPSTRFACSRRLLDRKLITPTPLQKLRETQGQRRQGVESVHMSSDESDTEERTGRRRERRRDSPIEHPGERINEVRQVPLAVPVSDPFTLEAEVADVQG